MTVEGRRLGVVGIMLALLAPSVAAFGESVVIRSTTVVEVRTGVPRPGVTIVVEGNRITEVTDGQPARIPDGAAEIDGHGKWVVPGFIDVHVHDSSDRDLTRALALGVTTVHLMPTSQDLSLARRQADRPPTAPIPRIHLTPVLFSGVFPDNLYPGVFPIKTPRNREDARTRINDLASRGVRQIKIIQDDGRFWNGPDNLVPRLSPEVFEELVEQAHRRGLRVYVHATQVRDTRQAILADVDAFMHGAMDEPLDRDLVSKMRDRSITWTPAFRIVLSLGNPRDFARRVLAEDRFNRWLSESEAAGLTADAAPDRTWPESPYQELIAHVAARMKVLGGNTRRARDGGARIAVGGDLGWVGIGTHVEMELLHEAGVTSAEVLTAATYGGAVALGIDGELGTIEPGKLADLVILAADPLLDVRNAREVEWTMKHGKLFRPSALLEATSSRRDPIHNN